MLPSSILVALAAIAGVLALVPSLVSRYDRQQRADFELSTATMRILARRRRKTAKPTEAKSVERIPAALRKTTEAADRAPVARGRATVAGALLPGNPADDALVHAALLADDLDEDSSVMTGPLPTVARGTASVRRPAPARVVAAATGGDTTAVFSTIVDTPEPTTGRGRLKAPEVARWWRTRRRRVLTVLALLVFGQLAGLLAIGPGFLIGLIVSAILLPAYVLQLRNRAVLEHRRQQVTARRRRRAQVVAGRIVAAAGIGAEPDLQHALMEWLHTPRPERLRPPVAAILTLLDRAGYDAIETDDKTWILRRQPEPEPIPAPTPMPMPRPAIRPAVAARAAAMAPAAYGSAYEDEPRVVNL